MKKEEAVGKKKISFFEKYTRDNEVKISPKFADEIDTRLKACRCKSLAEANKIIKV